MELGIPKAIIHSILIEKLDLPKVNSKFVPYQQKLQPSHCKDIIREAHRDENSLKTVITHDEI